MYPTNIKFWYVGTSAKGSESSNVYYLASLISSSMTSRYTLVPSKITDGGRSIFAYAALEKKVFNITVLLSIYQSSG